MNEKGRLKEMVRFEAGGKVTIDMNLLYQMGLFDIEGVEREPTEADILWAHESANQLTEEGLL